MPIPVFQDREKCGIDRSGGLVDKRKIDTRKELHGGRLVRIVFAAHNIQAINAVLMYRLRDGLVQDHARYNIFGTRT